MTNSKRYELDNNRILEMISLGKYQTGMKTYTHNGEFVESYAIISKQDEKNLIKRLKEVK